MHVSAGIVATAAATDDLGWVSGRIDYSGVRFFYLSGEGVFCQLQGVASGVHSAVLGVQTEGISG